MRVGLTLDNRAGDLGAAVEAAMAAERGGVDTLYVVERHFDQPDGYANAFAVAAAVGGSLQRAWIGVQPAIGLDHPLRVVEQSNVLDMLMRGRCVIVIAEAADAHQYDAFGLPMPRNGLLEDLVQQMERAWAWEFTEDGPPLEFQSGPFATRMAGRIMPATYRTPTPLLARETQGEVGVVDAARHGWTLHLQDGDDVGRLVGLYRQELASRGHPPSTVEQLLDRLSVRVDGPPEPSTVRRLAECGIAELRFDHQSEESLETLVSTVKDL